MFRSRELHHCWNHTCTFICRGLSTLQLPIDYMSLVTNVWLTGVQIIIIIMILIDKSFLQRFEEFTEPDTTVIMLVTSKNEPTVSGLQPWSLKHFSALCQNASRPCSISHSMEFLAFSNSASTWI